MEDSLNKTNLDATFLKEAIIPKELHGLRVDFVLSQIFKDFSRSQLTTWLKEGAVTLNHKHYKPKDKVTGGEHVKLNVTLKSKDITSLPEDIPLDIVFEDEHILIVNKPTGLVVHPGAGNHDHTLMNALLYHSPSLQQLPRAGIIHRLDKDTTGLLIVAKTFKAHASLIKAMQAREINRQYLTLVYGHIIASDTINTNYGRHPRNRLKMAVCTNGKEAITHFAINKQYQYFTLLDVTLMTGRTHQIRVHLAHINHPVVGDQLYGGRSRIPAGINQTLRTALQQFKRQALHACKLSLIHPETKENLTLTAPLPDDFALLLTTLDQNLE